jgi:hypothetical protein
VYEKAEANGRQTLLRNRANHIADYEALHHIHFWNSEPEPKLIYYFGQAKYLEEWYDTKKDDDKSAIYEGFEEISIFTNSVYKEIDYDKYSIFQYFNDDVRIVFENFSSDVNNNIKNLIQSFKDRNSIENIEKIEHMLEIEVKEFKHKLKKLKR